MVAIALVNAGVLPGGWLLVNAPVVGLAVLFERRGYHPLARNPEASRPTGERFRDPTRNELSEVWEDSWTAQREHRAASDGDDVC